jgi:tRNA(Ile)-lysidine synthase TilS/MesJ
VDFTQTQILKAVEVLGLTRKDIAEYFFNSKFKKTKKGVKIMEGLNARERLKIILKPVLTNADIMKLEGCKERWASKKINEWRPADTKLLRGQIKSSDYLNAKGITLDEFIERAVAEQQLENAGLID